MVKTLTSIVDPYIKLSKPIRNKEDIYNLGEKSKAELLNSITQSLSKDPKGLWQEIRTLPQTLQQAWKENLVPIFQSSAQEISKALKTKDPIIILNSMLNAACSLMEGFVGFFSYVSQKAPTLTKVVENATKIGLAVAVSVAAPYLSPAALAILVNADLLVSEGSNLIKEVSSKADTLQKSYEELRKKHSHIDEVSEIAFAASALSEKFQLPMDQITMLGLKVDQAQALVDNPAKGKVFLEDLLSAAQTIPLRASMFEELKEQITHTLQSQPSQKLAQVLSSISSAQSELGDNQNIFKQVIQVGSSFQKNIAPAMQELITEQSSPEVKSQLKKIEQTYFTQPIDQFHKVTTNELSLAKKVGMGHSDKMLLDKLTKPQAVDKNIAI